MIFSPSVHLNVRIRYTTKTNYRPVLPNVVRVACFVAGVSETRQTRSIFKVRPCSSVLLEGDLRKRYLTEPDGRKSYG